MASMVYSFSRLLKYERCQWSFYLKYVLGLVDKSTKAQDFGKTVHKAIAYILRDKLPKDKAIEKALQEAEFKHEAQKVFDVIDQLVVKMSERIDIQYVERHFQLPLNPDDKNSPEIQGHIDLSLTDSEIPTVIDWKTNWKRYTPLDDYQLGIYTWAISQTLAQIKGAQVEKALGMLYFLRYRDEHLHVYTGEDMEKARLWAYNLALEIEEKILSLTIDGEAPEDVFAKGPGNHCKTCSFAAECLNHSEQAAKSGSTANSSCKPATVYGKVPSSRQEAETLAYEILRLENVTKSYKEVLKEYVKEYGPLTLEGDIWEFIPSTSYKFLKPEDLMRFSQFLLNEKGLNPWKVLSLDTSSIKKLLDKKTITSEDLVRFAQKKSTKTFKKHKVEEEECGAVKEGAA